MPSIFSKKIFTCSRRSEKNLDFSLCLKSSFLPLKMAPKPRFHPKNPHFLTLTALKIGFQPRISNSRVYTFLSNTYRPSRGLQHLKLHRKRVFRKRSNHLVHFLNSVQHLYLYSLGYLKVFG